MGFMGLSGNAGRSRHGVRSREDAASARRVEQAALPRRNTGLKACAAREVLLYCSGKRFQPAGCTGHRPVFLHPPDKKN